MTTILEKGSITLPTKDLLRYTIDCNSLMRDIGDIITKDIVIPSDRGYLLIFYPFEKEEYILDKQQDCFFNIHYDKDLNLRFYTKGEFNIPKDMRYVILKI